MFDSILKKSVKSLSNKQTSENWANHFGIRFKNFDGFPQPHKEYFKTVFVTKETFFNYCANCELDVPINKSRREMNKFKKELNK